jgi:hypothetical protein
VSHYFSGPLDTISVLLSTIMAILYSSVSSQRFRLEFAGRAIRAFFSLSFFLLAARPCYHSLADCSGLIAFPPHQLTHEILLAYGFCNVRWDMHDD